VTCKGWGASPPPVAKIECCSLLNWAGWNEKQAKYMWYFRKILVSGESGCCSQYWRHSATSKINETNYQSVRVEMIYTRSVLKPIRHLFWRYDPTDTLNRGITNSGTLNIVVKLG
jgi:hypothetical protein